MMAVAALAAMLAAALLGRARAAPAVRVRALSLPSSEAADARGTVAAADSGNAGKARGLARPSVRAAAAAVIALAAIVVAGAVIGVVVGVAAAAAALLVRPAPVMTRVEPDEVPFVVDLVAGCLRAGAGMPEALGAAAQAAEEPFRALCTHVAVALRAGLQPAQAWRSWADDPWLAPVARTAVRTAHSGAAAADDLLRVSARLRARRRAEAQHRVRQASVWLVVPLGLCFLPAFVLVAVVPLVIGLLPSLR
jgi:Flp pilus assembly protein TadB